jgi:hypothetical protein
MGSRSDDDSAWRRPADAPASGAPGAGTPAGGSAGVPPGQPYAGPPPTTPPPAGWRPPTVVQPAPPRQLPAQDHVRLDAEEHSARTLTLGVGMVAGAIMLVLLLLLCGRALF